MNYDTDGCSPDNDTLFFFNYRSDRMREIVSIFGIEAKPMEVTVPSGLVRIMVYLRVSTLNKFLAHYNDVTL